MEEKRIDTLIVMGVHTNMCVLNRTFAIKQMVKWGRDVLPRPRPDRRDVQPEDEAVSSRTTKGTQLIIEYIEKHWCPTIESKALLAKP